MESGDEGVWARRTTQSYCHCTAGWLSSQSGCIFRCICNTLHHTATHYSATHTLSLSGWLISQRGCILRCICRIEAQTCYAAIFEEAHTPQHTATHCSTLQRTATHCNTLQHTTTHCNTLQHTATHYSATHCNCKYATWLFSQKIPILVGVLLQKSPIVVCILKCIYRIKAHACPITREEPYCWLFCESIPQEQVFFQKRPTY